MKHGDFLTGEGQFETQLCGSGSWGNQSETEQRSYVPNRDIFSRQTLTETTLLVNLDPDRETQQPITTKDCGQL